MTKVLDFSGIIHVFDFGEQFHLIAICLPVVWEDKVMVSIQVRN